MAQTDMANATARPDDVVAAVRRDHTEIRALFAKVQEAANADAKREAFRQLVRKLAVHETAEEEVVHPLLRKAPDGQQIAQQLLGEEDQGNKVLARLEKLDPADTGFDPEFAGLQRDVLQHAEHEEHQELPRLQQAVEEDRLEQLAKVFEVAETSAPTHPHPHSPESATGNLVMGPFVAIADRVRDAIRAAREKS